MEYLPEIGNAHIPSFRKISDFFSPTSPYFTNLTSPPSEGLGEVLIRTDYVVTIRICHNSFTYNMIER